MFLSASMFLSSKRQFLQDWNIISACSRISFHGKVLTLNCGSLEPGWWKSGQSIIRLLLLGLLAKIKV